MDIRTLLETYWNDIVAIIDKIYAYIKNLVLANEAE